MLTSKKLKRVFTSPIRFFGSDQTEGMEKAIDIVLDRAAKVASKQVSVTLSLDTITVTDDGKHLDVDFNEELEVWEYQTIFNHPIDISDESDFGLKKDQRLTLVQLASDFMNVTTFNGDSEYSLHFENGVTGNQHPTVSEFRRKKSGTSIEWRFDSSLFLCLTQDVPLDYYLSKLRALVEQYPEKIFTLCIRPDASFLERFEFSASKQGEVQVKHSKIRGAI